jgi:anti-sigma regulatory factor (Ser/Thr protein kinase)
MTKGFSTASPAVREMGFGAGMGLPNISENADSLLIETEVGKGTTLIIEIRF